MTTTISRPPPSDRLTSSKVIAVLRASDVAAIAPVCDVLVEEGILSLELTLTTPGLLDALSELGARYRNAADVGVEEHDFLAGGVGEVLHAGEGNHQSLKEESPIINPPLTNQSAWREAGLRQRRAGMMETGEGAFPVAVSL